MKALKLLSTSALVSVIFLSHPETGLAMENASIFWKESNTILSNISCIERAGDSSTQQQYQLDPINDSKTSKNFSEHLWMKNEESDFCKESLCLLLENKIPAIRISQFLTTDECIRITKAAEKVGFNFYEGVEPPIGKIGITQFEHYNKDKKEYFNKVNSANQKREQIFSTASINLLEKFQCHFFKELELKVSIAQEEEYGEYFAGLVRHINSAYLHFDYAPYDAPNWAIGRIERQLSWNVYLETPENEGGELIVYNKSWEPNIYESFHLPNHSGSYGFDKALVNDIGRFSIKPKAGELWLFNTQNFHEVLKSNEKRITFSSFIGKTKENNFILWS